jgi:hypothetical protein
MHEDTSEIKHIQEAASPTRERVRWFPPPCEACRGGTAVKDFLETSSSPDTQLSDYERNAEIETLLVKQRDALVNLAHSCRHALQKQKRLGCLARGSEHSVYYSPRERSVYKVTHPGCYGDFYEIKKGRINQYASLPREYLERLELWHALFGLAPEFLGVTAGGQIVSRQIFISGMEPTQSEVDEFLIESGFVALHQRCFLWAKPIIEGELVQLVVGDTRSENFKKTAAGRIVPIDLRIWLRDSAPVPIDVTS